MYDVFRLGPRTGAIDKMLSGGRRCSIKHGAKSLHAPALGAPRAVRWLKHFRACAMSTASPAGRVHVAKNLNPAPPQFTEKRPFPPRSCSG